jgi:hypothetical protein
MSTLKYVAHVRGSETAQVTNDMTVAKIRVMG